MEVLKFKKADEHNKQSLLDAMQTIVDGIKEDKVDAIYILAQGEDSVSNSCFGMWNLPNLVGLLEMAKQELMHGE